MTYPQQGYAPAPKPRPSIVGRPVSHGFWTAFLLPFSLVHPVARAYARYWISQPKGMYGIGVAVLFTVISYLVDFPHALFFSVGAALAVCQLAWTLKLDAPAPQQYPYPAPQYPYNPQQH